MRSHGLKKSLSRKFGDEIRFFKGWIDKPRTVGSIVPTSSITARRMASVIDLSSELPVLELGPGTGVITRAILARGVKPENVWSAEYSPDFVDHLRDMFPAVNVMHGDAFDLGTSLSGGPTLFDCAISGIPLLNFPVERRIALVNGVLDRLPAGRPLVQFTYGPLSPVPQRRGDYSIEHFDFVVRNLPPAQLWIYRRGARA
jgi:phosphatidylethanolamine/phosphatidyl-N-methylethanolamine N-methyltransferase